MADVIADEIGSCTPEDDQVEPDKSDASPVSDDYDPSNPTVEKGIMPSKMKVSELRTELTNRGLDSKGNKAALVQRLEEALETSSEQGPADVEESGVDGIEGEEVAMVEDGDEEADGGVESMEEVANNDGDTTSTEDIDAQDMEMDADAFVGTETADSKDPTGDSKDPTEDSKDPTGDSKDPTGDSKDPTGDSKDPTDIQEVASAVTKKELTNGGEQDPAESEKPPQAVKAKVLVPKAKPVASVEPKVAKKDPAQPQKEVEESTPAKEESELPAAKAKDEKVTDSVAKPKPEEDAKVEQGPPAELEKYWKAVKDKPTDFTGWTYLLQYVEQQGHMPSVRDAFDGFLARYPYCYGYWKKYADLERKKSKSIQKANEVFETGLKAIPLSGDLWMQYIQFVGQTASPEEATENLRKVYCKAIAAAGTDFRSDKLWDMYINFEKEQSDWQRVTKVYDQLLTIPTQLYSHHFEKFKEHVKKHHPKDILSVDEFIKLRMEVVDAMGVTEPGVDEGDEAGDDAPPGDDDVPPGVEIAPPGMEPASVKRTASSKQVEAENEAIRKKVLESRTVVYRQTEQEVSKRWAYEEGIRRPYFHAKPLEKSQLKNWREYLDFETTNGTHERVLILYERCLVACALYEEFWMRYAKYLEPHSTEGVSSVYKRACTIHLPKKPSIHLRWAAFEEKQGNKSAAQEILLKLEENVPDLIMVTMERLSLERRLGNAQAVIAILKDRLEAHKKPEIKTFFSMKLSRYYMKVLGDVSNARSALYEALEQAKDKVSLYLQLLDLEMQQIPSNESIILDLFQKGVDASTSVENKMKFSQRRLTYLMDFGTDVTKLQTAYEAHQVLLKEQLEILQSTSKKRNAEASDSTPAAPPAKKAKTEGPAPSATAAAAAAGKVAAAAAAASKTQPLLTTPAPPQPAPAATQDYNSPPPTGNWGGYNQASYGQQGGNYGPPPPGPGGYNQPPPNYNQQQYQQYQQAWGNYNQGYYPR